MDTQTPTPARAPVDSTGANRAVARHELVELFVLRQRPLTAGIAGTVVVCLLISLVAPSLLPSTALVGAFVGVLALAVGAGLAVVVDGQDTVLRGPWHARRDGSSVLGWMASPTPEAATPAAITMAGRTRAQSHTRVVLLGGGVVSEVARALGTATAGQGTTTLVVDMMDTSSQPGLAAVGEGSTKLAAAAVIADDRPLASIGVGRRQHEATEAAVQLLRQPPSDLQLVLVVAPPDPAARRSLVAAADRVVVVVEAGTRQRHTVRDELQRHAPIPAELLVVGGQLTDMAPGDAPETATRGRAPVRAAATTTGSAAPDAPSAPVGRAGPRTNAPSPGALAAADAAGSAGAAGAAAAGAGAAASVVGGTPLDGSDGVGHEPSGDLAGSSAPPARRVIRVRPDAVDSPEHHGDVVEPEVYTASTHEEPPTPAVDPVAPVVDEPVAPVVDEPVAPVVDEPPVTAEPAARESVAPAADVPVVDEVVAAEPASRVPDEAVTAHPVTTRREDAAPDARVEPADVAETADLIDEHDDVDTADLAAAPSRDVSAETDEGHADDLLTTATLEFLASDEDDAER